MDVEYLVIGGGPTGLGAACRLEERGADWHLLEAEGHFGGLASSFVDPQGFTWDLGGHVQFSHYETFDRYMDAALGEEGWFSHQRESWVWIRNRFVPYPFQNNLHRLDPADRWACVEGLLEAAAHESNGADEARPRPENFEEWMLATFGVGVTEIFMHPYNLKVWAYPPSALDYAWIGDRVAVPKLGAVLKSICTGQDEVSWGPNAVFRFPKQGGTGAVWQSIGRELPVERVSLSNAIEHIDVDNKVVTTSSADRISYKHLISSVPLNTLISLAPGVVDAELRTKLVCSATNVIGVGVDGPVPENLKTKCWMYFPENNSPYYRVTVFTNYSPNNAPRPGEQWSLMAEVSESPSKKVRHESLEEETVMALVEDGLIPDQSKICSVVSKHIPQGYPTPFLGRDDIVDPVLRAFENKGIYSRGRFGAWKYEVSNQDHSFAQGYECVERLLHQGGEEFEPTLFSSAAVNARRNP